MCIFIQVISVNDSKNILSYRLSWVLALLIIQTKTQNLQLLLSNQCCWAWAWTFEPASYKELLWQHLPPLLFPPTQSSWRIALLRSVLSGWRRKDHCHLFVPHPWRIGIWGELSDLAAASTQESGWSAAGRHMLPTPHHKITLKVKSAGIRVTLQKYVLVEAEVIKLKQ